MIKIICRIFISVCLCWCSGFYIALADSHSAVDEANQLIPKDIDDAIKTFILNHPEIIIESLNTYQAKQELTARKETAAVVEKLSENLLLDPMVPKSGNPNGDLIIIEFFDYRCGYCKKALSTVQQLLAEDSGIKYVLKEFPILGEASTVAARYALSTWLIQPTKYDAFRQALLKSRGELTQNKVKELGISVGVDLKSIEAGLTDPRIEIAIQSTYREAEALKINGTPAFIIGKRIVRGAADIATLKLIVDEERGS